MPPVAGVVDEVEGVVEVDVLVDVLEPPIPVTAVEDPGPVVADPVSVDATWGCAAFGGVVYCWWNGFLLFSSFKRLRYWVTPSC